MSTLETPSASSSSDQNIWSGLTKLLLDANHVVLTTHENSDGDGLGSQIGIYNALNALGKDVTILNPTEIPNNYKFLFEDFHDHENMVFSPENPDHQNALRRADVCLVLDTNSIARIGKLKDHVLGLQQSDGLKIGCVDHHLEPQDFADIMICLSYASATGELVYDLIRIMEKSTNMPLLNQHGATGLYTALMTDTGSFRFPKTTPHVHQIAASLVSIGVEPSYIHKQVYSIPYTAMRLIGQAINNIQLEMDGRIGYLLITQHMFRETATSQSDTERITEFLMSLDCIDVGLVFIETDNGAVKVSLRSHGDVYVNQVAKKFDGGGHKNAAGCRINMPPYKAIEAVLMETQQLLNKPHIKIQED